MKTNYPPNKIKLLIAALGLTALGITSTLGEVAKVYSARQATGSAWNSPCFDYLTAGWLTSGGKSVAPGTDPSRAGAFYRTASTTSVGRGWGCTHTADTNPGQMWMVYVTCFSDSVSTPAAINMQVGSSNALLTDAPLGGNVVTITEAFRRTNAASPRWGFVCYVQATNASQLHPEIHFGYDGGATGSERLLADSIKWEPYDICLAVPAPTIDAPYTTNMTSFTVAGVNATATDVSVWKQNGSDTPVRIAQLTSGILADTNLLTLAPGATLEKNSKIWATQTVSGQKSCDHAPRDYFVGIGNSNLKFCFYMGNNATTPLAGPIGADGSAGNGSLYFMPAPNGDNASYPKEGVDIACSPNWQTVTIDPRTTTHGNYSAGALAGDPWVNGRPAFQTLNSFVFMMVDSNSGPYEVFIDNFYNGSTEMYKGWETAIEEGALTNVNPGLFATFTFEGSTSASLTGLDAPLSVTTVATGTNAAPVNQFLGGTNSQYVKWQWNQVSSSGVWCRKACRADGVKPWAAYPQVDMNKPIHFDILLAPAGSTPHAVGKVTWLEDTTVCGNSGGSIGVTATPPTDPATGLPMARTYTYAWTKDGSPVGGNTSSLTVNATGHYEVTVSDQTGASLKRNCNVTFNPGASWAAADGATVMPSGVQVEKLGDSVAIGGTSGILAAPTCGIDQNTITYKWIRNGTVDLGPGQSLNPGTKFNIASATSDDAGTYTCVATTAYGSVTSTPCILYFGGLNTGTGDGLRGDYYNAPAPPLTVPNAMSGTPTLTRTDHIDLVSGIQFNWSTNSPDPAVQENNFLVRWTGSVMPPINGRYFFRVGSDDGCRLWANFGNGWEQLLSAWVNRSYTNSGSFNANGYVMEAGRHYPIMLEYFETGSDARVQLMWGCSNINQGTWATVPGLLAGSDYPGMVISNYNLFAASADFVKPVVHLTAPTGTSGGTQPYAATLTATVTTNDGAFTRVEFLTNGVSFATNTVAPFTKNVTLNAGSYTIKARVYYNDTWYEDSAETATVNVQNVVAVVITGMTPGATAGFDINYKDGQGSDFVLYKTLSLTAPITWTPVATNHVGTGAFNISTTDAAAFYKVLSR